MEHQSEQLLIQNIPPEPLAKVWILVSGAWQKAMYWKCEKGSLVFTTNGKNEIKDCEWKYRE